MDLDKENPILHVDTVWQKHSKVIYSAVNLHPSLLQPQISKVAVLV